MSDITHNINRLYYIDPNEMPGASSIRNSKVSPDNITWNQEDLSIYVDLKAVVPDRFDCGQINYNSKVKELITNKRLSKDSTGKFVSILNGMNLKEDKPNFLTTSYLDISYQSIKNNGIGDTESLCISSININFDESFYPQITIHFVDVRGNALLSPSEENMKDPSTYGSFFSALFHYPYPRFILTVRGFYGDEVSFNLAVNDFKSSLNNNTGNFEIVVKFIGYMYGLYAEIPFNLMLIGPYIDGGDTGLSSQYWLGKQGSTFVFADKYGNSSGKMMTFAEYLMSYDNIAKKLANGGETTETIQKENDAIEKRETLDSLRDSYKALLRIVKSQQNQSLTIRDDDEGNKQYGIFISSLNKCKDEFGIDLTSYTTITSDMTTIVYSSEESKMENMLNRISDERKIQNQTIKELTDAAIDDIITIGSETLGFYPSIYNFYRLTFAHIECFTNSFYSLLKEIKNNINNRKISKYNLDSAMIDIKGYDKLPPFTGFYKDTGEDNKREFVYPGEIDSCKDLEEVKFVEKVIKAAIGFKNKVNEAIAAANNFNGDGETTYNYTPTSLFDIETGPSNPYAKVSKVNGIDDIEKLDLISTRRLLISYYTTFNKDATELSNINENEANNIANFSCKSNTFSLIESYQNGNASNDNKKWGDALVQKGPFEIQKQDDKYRISLKKYDFIPLSEDLKEWHSYKYVYGYTTDVYGKNATGGIMLPLLRDNKGRESNKYSQNYSDLTLMTIYDSSENNRIDTFVNAAKNGVLSSFVEKEFSPENFYQNGAFIENPISTYSKDEETKLPTKATDDYVNLLKIAYEGNNLDNYHFKRLKNQVNINDCGNFLSSFPITQQAFKYAETDFLQKNRTKLTKIPKILVLYEGYLISKSKKDTVLDKENRDEILESFYKNWEKTDWQNIKRLLDNTSNYYGNSKNNNIKHSSDLEKKLLNLYFEQVYVRTIRCSNDFGGGTSYNTPEIIDKDYFVDAIGVVINKYKSLCNKENSDNKINNSTESITLTDVDVSKETKTALYYTLKNIYDKWLCTYTADQFILEDIETERSNKKKRYESNSIVPESSDNEFENFVFVDAFFNDISDKLVLNPENIYNDIISQSRASNNFSIFEFMAKMAQSNSVMFLSMPFFADIFNKNVIERAFIPHSEYSNKKPANLGTTYVCMYTHEASYVPEDCSDIEGDGMNLFDVNGVASADIGGKFDLKSVDNLIDFGVPAFAVNFGKQNQSYFKNINISLDTPRETDYSIKKLFQISTLGTQGENSRTIGTGQDLYSIYSNRQYTCNIDMLGCMDIMPMMMFQLNNIPMVRGAYVINNVSHTITPGDMQTSFSGIRISPYKYPYNKDIFKIRDFVELVTAQQNNGGGDNLTPGANGDVTVVETQRINETPNWGNHSITVGFDAQMSARGGYTHESISRCTHFVNVCIEAALGTRAYWSATPTELRNKFDNSDGKWVCVKKMDSIAAGNITVGGEMQGDVLLEIPNNGAIGHSQIYWGGYKGYNCYVSDYWEDGKVSGKSIPSKGGGWEMKQKGNGYIYLYRYFGG